MIKKIFRGAIFERILLNLISDASNGGLYGYAVILAVHKKFEIRLGPSALYLDSSIWRNRASWFRPSSLTQKKHADNPESPKKVGVCSRNTL